MARVAITEYAAKKLILGDSYNGITVTPDSIQQSIALLDEKAVYIVKIDVGIKKRGKKGLIRLNISKTNAENALKELFALGYNRCVIEEMVPHLSAQADETSDERYISIDLQRIGAQILYSAKGGVEIEDNHDDIERFFVPQNEVLEGDATLVLENVPLSELLTKMQCFHISFLEINPFIVKNGSFTALDMAALIDDAKESKLPTWMEEHSIKKAGSPQEKAVQKQDEATAAALTLKILNKNGSILTLLSGGGASLVAMDTLVTNGLQEQIINYSEYSGAPTRDETEAYVNTLLEVLFASTAKKKVILIAGGVANFTDIMTTFQGIIDAFSSKVKQLQAQNIAVCVRRGGPNQEKGLAHLRDFLVEHNIANDVHDPSLSLGEVGILVKKYL